MEKPDITGYFSKFKFCWTPHEKVKFPWRKPKTAVMLI